MDAGQLLEESLLMIQQRTLKGSHGLRAREEVENIQVHLRSGLWASENLLTIIVRQSTKGLNESRIH